MPNACGPELESLGLVFTRSDELLPAVCRAARSLLLAGDWDAVVSDILQDIGRTAHASRAYLLLWTGNGSDPQTVMLRRLKEWCDLGTSPLLSGVHGNELVSSAAALDEWIRQYLAGEPVCGVISHFGPVERQFLLTPDVLSAAVFPVIVDGRLWGAIGLDDCRSRRRWKDGELLALRGLADILGAAIQRRSLLEAVQSAA